MSHFCWHTYLPRAIVSDFAWNTYLPKNQTSFMNIPQCSAIYKPTGTPSAFCIHQIVSGFVVYYLNCVVYIVLVNMYLLWIFQAGWVFNFQKLTFTKKKIVVQYVHSKSFYYVHKKRAKVGAFQFLLILVLLGMLNHVWSLSQVMNLCFNPL